MLVTPIVYYMVLFNILRNFFSFKVEFWISDRRHSVPPFGALIGWKNSGVVLLTQNKQKEYVNSKITTS